MFGHISAQKALGNLLKLWITAVTGKSLSPIPVLIILFC